VERANSNHSRSNKGDVSHMPGAATKIVSEEDVGIKENRRRERTLVPID